MNRHIFCSLLLITGIFGFAQEDDKILTLHKSLDPRSVVEHLAFYELYPDTELGKRALRKAWELLADSNLIDTWALQRIPPCDVQALVRLVTHQTHDPPMQLEEEQLIVIERIARNLHNRKLQGFGVEEREKILALAPEEIDLARALLLFQFDPPDIQKIRRYEANIDIMALQIRARLSANASYEEKIHVMNHFLFQEMGFRFPPHSLYARHIDHYTFLPSVLDSRQGVCLGISILYLSLAQRLDLPLEIITPPGHIYLRYRKGEEVMNIETTARGIDTPSEMYLGVNTRLLQVRNMKETVGFAFINQASTLWDAKEYKQCIALYEKARLFIPNDPSLQMFLGCNHFLRGNYKKAISFLQRVRNHPSEVEVSPSTLPEDILLGRVDRDAFKAIFMPVNETRASILAKQEALQQALKRCPRFREGLMQLAVTYLQLNRLREAEEILLKYHSYDDTNVIVEYYLALIALQRWNHQRSWSHLKRAEMLCRNSHHSPKALQDLRRSLLMRCPE